MPECLDRGALVGYFSRIELGPAQVCSFRAPSGQVCLALSDRLPRVSSMPVQMGFREVIEIENRPVNQAGNITQPVSRGAISLRRDGKHAHRAGSGPASRGPGPGRAGERGIYEPSAQRSRVGQVSVTARRYDQVTMSFGTVPLTHGLWIGTNTFGAGNDAVIAEEKPDILALRARSCAGASTWPNLAGYSGGDREIGIPDKLNRALSRASEPSPWPSPATRSVACLPRARTQAGAWGCWCFRSISELGAYAGICLIRSFLQAARHYC